MRIGIIGAGGVGTTLGQGWTRSGHEVVYGARDPAPGSTRPGAKVESVQGAAKAADVVVLTTPWSAARDALRAAGDLGGKPLIDVTNAIGPGLTLSEGHTTSGAEIVASMATNARVVKAFNSTGRENMADPRYGDHRVMMPLAGDDPAAVDVARRLAADLGFEPVALHPLTHAREIEPLAVLWIKLAMQWGLGRNVAFGVARRAPGDRAVTGRRTAHPRTITVVGSGNIGRPLARAWLRAGHHVRIAARDPGAPEVGELTKQGARAVPLAESAEGAEVVVFAIPAGAVREAAGAMGGLAGKVVVDCTNAIGKGFVLEYGHTTSSAEELAKALPGARVVRSFNQQGAEVLDSPVFSGRPATNFVASDDPEARAVVRELAADVGLEGVEAGPLASSRYLEPLTMLWIAMAQALGTREFGLSLLRR